MGFDPAQHHRRSVRLATFDYIDGAFFVTICTTNRECTLGEIVDGLVRLKPVGEIVAEEWIRSSTLRAEVNLDEWVVMPNHLHGILHLEPVPNTAAVHSPLPRRPGSLGSVVGGFKSAVTTRVNTIQDTPGRPVWQRGYHEHVIRTERELRAIREYIADNPRRWGEDEDNPVNWKR